jgi:hypothetical protein
MKNKLLFIGILALAFTLIVAGCDPVINSDGLTGVNVVNESSAPITVVKIWLFAEDFATVSANPLMFCQL